jgi:hypothetical protein
VTRKGLWIAATVVIVSNAFTLWAARANRAGEPEAVLELTERELRLPAREADNTAMTLQLEWTDLQPRYPAEAVPTWFDQAKLASIGFDTSLPVTRENAARYRGMAPRAVYAVLEHDGEAWRRYVEGLPSQQDKDTASGQTRLVLIDVGTDPSALRAKHPDRRRTAVVPATAGIVFVQPRSGEPFLKGHVNTVFPLELNVPKALRPALESLAPRPMKAPPRQGEVAPALRDGELALAGEPRYRVTVKWGRSLEPWIAKVEATRIAGL